MSASVQNILSVAGRVRIRSGYLHAFDLLSGMAERGYNVSLACASVPPEVGLRRAAVPVTTWGQLARRWPGYIGRQTFQDFLREQEAQVIHVHGVGLQFAGRRFLNAVETPVVFTAYSTAPSMEVTRIQQRAARVIALSEYMREGLVNRCRVPREKLRVVAPGIDARRYELLLPRLGSKTPVVGTVAPLEPGRGQSVFLRAARIVLAARMEAEFIVAGDGPSEAALRREAADLGVGKHVAFLTRLRDYRSVIAAVDIFVRPGSVGGLGYTVLEGMAMGKAVIATASGDIPELIADGRTGIIAPKEDPDALAREIGRLIERPAVSREMGMAARQEVMDRFGMDQLIERTTRVYAEAVEQ